MSRRFERIARDIVDHARLIRWALIALVIVSAMGVSMLETDMSPKDLSAGVGDQDELDRIFHERFGSPDNTVLLLVHADDVTSPHSLSILTELEKRLSSKDYARSVRSIATLPVLRGHADAHRLVPAVLSGAVSVGPATRNSPPTEEDSERVREALRINAMARTTLVSADHTLTGVVLRIADDLDRDPEIAPVVADIEAVVRSVNHDLDADVTISGLPYVRNWLIRQVAKEQYTLFPASILKVLILLFITFRWLPAIFLPAVVVGITALVVLGGMGVTGEPINVLSNMVPILIIIVGISGSIHLINRFGEELSHGKDRRQAAISALGAMALPMLLTSITSASGFSSLAVSSMRVLRNFGLTAAAGIMVAYVITVLLVPPAIAWAREPKRPLAQPSTGRIERLNARIAGFLVGRGRWPALIVGAVALVACALQARHIPVDNFHRDQFDEDSDIYQTIDEIDTKLTGIQTIEIMLTSSDSHAFTSAATLEALGRAARWTNEQPGVRAVTTYAGYLRAVWSLIDPSSLDQPFSAAPLETVVALGAMGGADARQFLTPNRLSTHVAVYVSDIGGKAIVALANQVRAELERELAGVPDLDIVVSGEGYVSAQGLSVVIRDLLYSVLTAAVLIFIFLSVALRSLRLGLLSLPPNILPLIATLVYMQARGIALGPATVIIFSISVGLAVDGTIHVLSRFREEMLNTTATPAQAMVAAAVGTGKAVTASYLSLIVGFLVLQLSGFVPIRRLGELISITVFGCLIATLFLLPPLVATVWPKRARAS